MTAIKTSPDVGPQTQAQSMPFAADSAVPKTNVWDAIHFVYAALLAAISGPVARAQYAADDAKATALEARGSAARAQVGVRLLKLAAPLAQYTADDARSVALEARGQAQKALTRIRKIDDVQIALKAQVFN